MGSIANFFVKPIKRFMLPTSYLRKKCVKILNGQMFVMVFCATIFICFTSCSDDDSKNDNFIIDIDSVELTGERTTISDNFLGRHAYLAIYNITSGTINDHANIGGGYLTGGAGEHVVTASGENVPRNSNTAGRVDVREYQRNIFDTFLYEQNDDEIKWCKECGIFNSNSRADSRNGALDEEHEIGDSLDVYVENFYRGAGGGRSPVTFLLKAVSDNCDVWAETGLTMANGNPNKRALQKYGTDYPINDTTFEDVAKTLSDALAAETNIFGTTKFNGTNKNVIDSSDRVHIMILPLYYGLNSDGTKNCDMCGYFSSSDVMISGTSNKAECIFLNNNIDRGTLFGTLVHEAQHLTGCVKYKNNGLSDYKSWYTEMLSVLSEDVLHDYLGESLISSHEYLSVFNNNTHLGFGYWYRDSYGPAYIFGIYLARKFCGDSPVNFIKTLALCNAMNEDAIECALKEYGYNMSFIDALTGEAQYILNHNTFSDSKIEKIGDYEYRLHAMELSPKIYTNTADDIGRPDFLGGYGFYIIDIGCVEKGSEIILDGVPNPKKIKTFAIFK